MKQVSQFLAPVALAAAAFCAPQAQAANQYAQNASYLGNGTYIGIFDPSVTPTENSFISSTSPTANGTFTDFWVFDINPSGNSSASLSFLNISNSFTAFSVQLFKDQAPLTNVANGAYTIASQSRFGLGGILSPTGPGSLTLVPQTSSSFGIGTQFGGGTTANTNGFLAAGRYVVKVTGTTASVGQSNPTYSGQIQVNQVPEPTTLALAGLALLGSAAAMRKRKSV